MEQEHRITYKAGITRTPSDFLCQDGELAECINLATDNEELKPVVQPVYKISFGLPTGEQDWPTDAERKAVYIHKFNNTDRYVLLYCMSPGHSPWYMYWTTDGVNVSAFLDSDGQKVGFATENVNITSIGKTLIVSAEGDIHYWLWKQSGYTPLGNIIPTPNVEFALFRETSDVVRNSGTGNVFDFDQFSPIIEDGKQEEYNDLIVGLYSKNKKAVCQKKGFCEPFLIRTAVKLYDGSYIHISAPQVLFPSVSANSYADELTFTDYDVDRIQLLTEFSKLLYKNSSDFTDWEDIVKDITIFVSPNINIYDTGVDQNFRTMELDEVITDGVYRTTMDGLSEYHATRVAQLLVYHYQLLTVRDAKEIKDEITSSSLFFKIADIGLSGDSQFHDMSEKIYTHTLENLSSQERLENDDYYSYSKMYPELMYSYNSRLNISRVLRGFFEGFGSFMPFDQSTAQTYNFYVTIKTEAGDVTVMHEETTKQKQGIYFYYPDSRARHVKIFKNGTTKILDEDLKEHPGLNGAYYIAGLPSSTNEPTGTTDTPPSYNNDALETLPNYIIQSEVNNPWVFQAAGYHKVGTGKIIGMSTITQALSQGQFGQYPLLVFSESGIWAMSVDSTGLYQSIHPMSRDVCLNPNSILQTDGTVFFVSKKGLMVIVGNEVRCVSELMNGRAFNTAVLSPLATGTDWAGIVSACQGETTFLEYIRDEATFMSYDYIDSRIIITKPGAGFSFAYNIADGTISKVILPAAMTGAVNNYPDYLLQGTVTVDGTTQNRLYSYYEKPREENVAERQLGFVLTRPMKLAGPVSQASLRQLMNVGTWRKKDAQGNELSCVKTEVYLSEDMQTWFPDISRYGAAARYYRLALFIKMLPTERLSGTILTEQERRSHNMR